MKILIKQLLMSISCILCYISLLLLITYTILKVPLFGELLCICLIFSILGCIISCLMTDKRTSKYKVYPAQSNN